MNTRRIAAFFDVDGTLIRKDSQALEAGFILKNKLWSPAYLGKILLTLVALQLSRLGWISLERQNEIYITTYKGRTRQWLEKQAEELFVRKIEKNIIPESLALLQAHRRKGDLIVLVSATTHHLLMPFDKLIDPDAIFCTHLEFGPDKVCTGRSQGKICVRNEKQIRVRQFAEKMEIDLENSHAYTDHHSDICFLESVGHPHVINPTKKLAAYARKLGWPLYRF